MKKYEKPNIDITVIDNSDIVTLSGGGLQTGKFTIKTDSQNNMCIDF